MLDVPLSLAIVVVAFNNPKLLAWIPLIKFDYKEMTFCPLGNHDNSSKFIVELLSHFNYAML